MATALKKYNGGRVMVFVMGAFAEMSGDVTRICDLIDHELWRGLMSRTTTTMPSGPGASKARASMVLIKQYGDAKRTKGMCRQRIQKAWGHTAHRG